MPRQARVAAASGVYHICARGLDRQLLFEDDYDCLRYLQTLDTVPVDGFVILAFCLMGNHVHLLVKVQNGEDGLKTLEKAMKSIAARYAFHYNKRYRRNGVLFQGRYLSKVVDTKGYFVRVLRYIHANPVKAGLTDTMGEYAYSSYNDYFAHRKPLCRLDVHYAQQVMPLPQLLVYHAEEERKLKDFIADDATPPAMLDDVACAEVCRIVGCAYAHDIATMPTPMRDAALKMLEHTPMSIRQLSRVTGVSRGIIKRLRLQ